MATIPLLTLYHSSLTAVEQMPNVDEAFYRLGYDKETARAKLRSFPRACDILASLPTYQMKKKAGCVFQSWLVADQMTEDTEMALKIYAPDKGMDEGGLKMFRREYTVTAQLNQNGLLKAIIFPKDVILERYSVGSYIKLWDWHLKCGA